MRWGLDLLNFELLDEGMASPTLLDRVEWSFYLDLARAPVLDAVEECGIETRRYGPVLAAVVAALPEEGHFNRVLGAAAPGAATGGHLEEALDWTESLGQDVGVPVTPGLAESAATEALLERRGYRRRERRARFLRPAAPPDFEQPPGISVVEASEEQLGDFSGIPGAALGLDPMTYSFLDLLPSRECWSGYLAYDADGELLAGASMFRHLEVAILGFAATREDFRGRGAHLALLHRRIGDSATPFCHTLCAEVELSAGEGRDDSHPAARNLLRAGFHHAATRSVWRPPEDLVAPDEDEDEDEDDWRGGDDPDEPDDGDRGPAAPRKLVLQG